MLYIYIYWYYVSLTYQKLLILSTDQLSWKILLKLGLPERFVGLIRSLHNGMKARVSFNGTLSEEISINNGVKQADISTPMLFNIYLAIVFLVAFYENSDGIYIIYRTSGSVFNVRRLLSQRQVSFHWWGSCSMRITVILLHILKLSCNALWTILYLHVTHSVKRST